MLTRRNTLLLGAFGALSTVMANQGIADDAPVLTEDGLYKQPWFLESFLDLEEDLTTANDEGKRFVVFWELKGCPYCKETHFVNLARPDIREFVRSRFEVLQLNIIGSRIVTDFDGEELSEKELARKYAVRFTPTFQFFPASSEGLKTMEAPKREVARAPGYLKPDHFLSIFQFVESRTYLKMSFRQYLRTKG